MTQITNIDYIQKVIKKLKNLTEIDIQNQWLSYDQDLSNPPQYQDISEWQRIEANDKNYLVWSSGNRVLWLAQKINISPSLNNYLLTGFCLRLALTWWAQQAQIFVNGKLVQEGDLFDSSARVLLTSHVILGQEFLVSLRLVSPGHDIGALMKSKCVYEIPRDKKKLNQQGLDPQNYLQNYNLIDAGFVANELAIITNYLTIFNPEQLPILAQEIKSIDWQNVHNRDIFHQSLMKLRNNLINFSQDLKKRSFYLLGHAHLDMAWLWETKETYQVAQRTFNSVLNLQKDFPNLTFGHTTACLYEWIENHNPQLFLEIQHAVQKGNWEILGGMWIEPEVNLVSGESLIRQLLYGQKYFQTKFGKVNRVAWLPDSFGFPWQLPQILQQAEIDYFVTGKLHWNDTNKFPYPCFWWQSPDGSQIFTLMSPPNVTGVMDTNPLTMTNYALDWEQQTGLKDIFWLPGVGDHGGGPTHDMLDVAQVYSNSPFFPNLKFTSATNYLDQIHATGKQIPIWNNELYLELHRGCYTTHGDQKYFNRYSENLLYQVELFSTVATLLAQKVICKRAHFSILQKNNIISDFCQANLSQNQAKIESIWKQVLFNQFHDILPGTSIPEVFEEANHNWRNAITQGEEILNSSLNAIASYLDLPKPLLPEAKPVIIFNALNWQRTEIVEIDLPQGYGQIYNLEGQKVTTQISANNTLLFLAENIPSIGYKVFWLLPQEKTTLTNTLTQELKEANFILENQYLKVKIDLDTGDIKSLWDKVNQQEVFKNLGNQLQFFQDQGQYWDAWNIDPYYEQYPLNSSQLQSIQWLEKGALRSIIRVTKIFQNSQFIQDYILSFNSPILDIKNKVNWQEDHVLVKVAFPFNINSDYVTYEIACGAIQRTTKPKTKLEKAQWEVNGLKWADLSTNNYGISILNNGKNGYDSSPNQIRLSLLRSPTWPNPKADRGLHHFTYSLYPHWGDWKLAQTVQKSYQLNIPLQVLIGQENSLNLESIKILPPVNSFLNLGAKNLILMAFKLSENNKNKVILRCYESQGENAELKLENNLNLEIQNQVNLLENIINNNPDLTVNLNLAKPWQILTLKLSQIIV